ncbi:MAG: HIT domain-containing protein [Actinomycetota bacterium]|nr:HIT domain-containing protein [Actinomycetota bacterium]
MTFGPGQMWAGWRSDYIRSGAGASSPDDEDACVFCRILSSGEPDESTYIVRRRDRCLAILNAYPYTNGHLMVMPARHVADLEDLTADESFCLWSLVTDAVRALKSAYKPDGINVGANLGRAAGAGIPGHLHIQCLPRWVGDTSFMTSLADVRVLNEALPETWVRLREGWPQP